MAQAVAVSRPSNGGVTPVPASPFSQEPGSDLLARRGQEFSLGATDMVSAAIRGAAAMQASAERGQNTMEARDEEIRARGGNIGIADLTGDEFVSSVEKRAGAMPRTAAQDRPLFGKAGEFDAWARDTVGVPPQDDSFWSKFAQGAGSFAAFMAAAIPAAATGPAGMAAVGGTFGAAANSGQIYQEALDNGASEDQALDAAGIGRVVGASEIVPVLDILKPLEKTFPELKSKIIAVAGKALRDASEEGLQEGLAQIANNLIASGHYDPERGWDDGVTENALIGFALGGLASGTVGTVTGGAGERPPPAMDTPPVLPANPQEPRPDLPVTPEQLASPIQTQLLQEGQAIIDAAVAGQPIPMKPPAVEAIPSDEAAVLFAAGYDAENIADMSPEERAAEVADARDQGVTGIDPGEAQRRIDAMRDVQPATSPTPNVSLAPSRPLEGLSSGDSRLPGPLPSAAGTVAQPSSERNPGASLPPVAAPAAPEATSSDETGAAGPAAAPVVKSADNADLVARAPLQPEGDESPGDIVSLDPSRIKTDAARFQFKEGGDAQGVTQSLAGTKKWSDEGSGIAVVWEDEKGERFIVDGHQRLGLAQRLKVEGQTPRLRAIILREKDGVTAEEAMKRGAIKNLQEGGESTTAVDIAKVFRRGGTTEAVTSQIPPNRKAYRDGLALAKLGDEAFGLVVNDRVPAAYAADVGREIQGDAPQLAALGYLAENPPGNAQQARIIIGQMKAEGFESETQDSLFGSKEIASPLFVERATILDNASRHLKMLSKVFKTAIDSEKVLSEAGNVLDSAANTATLTENQRLALALEKLSQRKGPISDALSEQARKLNAGEITVGKAREAFLEAVGQPDAGAGGEKLAVGGSGDRPAGKTAEVTTKFAKARGDTATVDMFAEPAEKPTAKASPAPKPKGAPLYVERVVTDASEIIAWARAQGFKTTLPPAEMHVTIAFSKDPVDKTAVPARGNSVDLKVNSKPKALGDAGAIVLPISGDAMLKLKGDWNRYRKAGASWDFPSYQPHITLTYDKGEVDLDKVEPFVGSITLGGEQQKALNPDGAADAKAPEVPTGATEEPGAEGLPQQVIPGAERMEPAAAKKAASADRNKAEIAARQQQSKMRRAGQSRVEDGEDGLFGEPAPTLKFAKARSPFFSAVLRAVEGSDAPDTQGVADSIVRHADRLRDITQARTFRAHGFGGLDVPGKTAVLKEVFAAAQNSEVRRAVVKAIPVDVVDVLRRKQLSPERLFDVEAVFLDLFSVSPNSDVAIRSDVATAMVNAATRQAAKVVGELSNMTGSLRDGFAADGALNHRHDPSLLGDGGNSKREARARGVTFEATPDFIASAASVARDLARDLGRIAPGVDLSVVRRLFAGDTELSGMFQDDGLIAVALDAPGRTAAQTLGHEALHALRSVDMFRPAEWAALSKAARGQAERVARAREEYPDLDTDGQTEEVIADMFGDWRAGNLEAKGFVRSAFERVKAFLDALASALRGNGFTTAEAVFRRVESGTVGKRGAAAEMAASEPRVAAAKARPASAERIEQAEPPTDLVSNEITLADETQRQFLWRKLKDDKNRLFQAQKTVERLSGAAIPENLDAYLVAGLFQTKSASALKKYQETTVSDLLREVSRAIRSTKATQADIDAYLFAHHAPARNKVMAERDPKWQTEPGSGMSDEDAARIIAEAKAKGWEPAFERVAQKVYAMLKADVALREQAGLIDPETVAAWDAMYPDGRYVPFRGFAERNEDEPEPQIGAMRTGRGFDIRGPESKAAKGRSSQADSPVAYAIMMGAEGIVRAGKNKVAKTMYRFASLHPTSAVRALGKRPMKQVPDLATGKMVWTFNDEALRQPNILAAKIGGKPYYMELAPELAVGMKNLGVEQLDKATRAARKLTRFWSSMLTSRNPAFFIPNATVDFMTGILTSMQADAPRGNTRRYIMGYANAITALWQWNAGLPMSAKWKARIAEWEADGGRMDFYGYQSLEDIKAELEKAAKTSARGRVAGAVKGAVPGMFKAVEWINTPFENAARFAAYNAARNLGVSRQKAAMHSLESSGNFARRGEWTPFIGSWWPFFGASMTGLGQLAGFAKHPATQAVLVGAVMFPLIWGITAANMYPGDDDPEGLPLYFRIPDYERGRSIVIPRGVIEEEIENPDGSTRVVQRLDYNLIRIPHALRPFWTLGDQIAAAYFGGVSVGEIFEKTLASALFNWNPISGSDPVAMMLPLVGDPIYELTTNRDSLGRQIRPEGYGGAVEGVPAYSWKEGQTSPAFIKSAQGLNTATGGDSVTPGAISIHPDHVEYLWEFVSGGLGRFASETAQTVQNKLEGVETPPNRIPIIRTTIGRTDARGQTDRFYDLLNEGETLADRLTNTKGKVKTGELGDAEWNQVLDLADQMGVKVVAPDKDVVWKGSWLGIMRKARDASNEIRLEIRATMARTDWTRAEVEAEVKVLRGRQEAIMLGARTRALELRANLPTP